MRIDSKKNVFKFILLVLFIIVSQNCDAVGREANETNTIEYNSISTWLASANNMRLHFIGQQFLVAPIIKAAVRINGHPEQIAPTPSNAPTRSKNVAQLPGKLDHPQSESQISDPVTIAVDAAPGVFGSVAISFSHLKVMTHWKSILAQVTSDGLEKCFGQKQCPVAEARIERAVMATDTVAKLVEKLQLINTAVNKAIGYQSDLILYGMTDYWAKPSETLLRGKGDCEDFAILKMAALYEAGIPAKSMSIVVLRDRKHGFFHAVLAVSTTQGDFILDILNSRVRLDRSYPDYQPLYSIAGNKAWIHGYPNSKQLASNTAMMIDVAPGTGPAGSLPAQFVDGNATIPTAN